MPDFANRRSRIEATGKATARPKLPESRQAVPVAIAQMSADMTQKPGAGMREALRTIDKNLQRGFRELEAKLQPPNAPSGVTPPPGATPLSTLASRISGITAAAATPAPPAAPKPTQVAVPPAQVRPMAQAPTRALTPTRETGRPAQQTTVNQHTHNVRNISNVIAAARERSAPANVPMATVADQRAYYQYASERAPQHEADATRLAKVAEAAELIKEGKMAPNKQIQEWAAAIRSGDRRRVADIHPQTVQNTLQEAAGGRQAAKVLNTAKVARIEEEHQTNAQALRTRLAEKRKAEDRYSLPSTEGGHAKRLENLLRIRESSKPQPAPAVGDFVSGKGMAMASPHSRLHHEETSAPTRSGEIERPTSLPTRSEQDQQLTSMMRYNDLSHASMAVGALESSSGKQDPSLNVAGKEMGQKIGQVLSPSAATRAGTTAMKLGKAPWGEGRELRQMSDQLSALINEVRRSYS